MCRLKKVRDYKVAPAECIAAQDGCVRGESGKKRLKEWKTKQWRTKEEEDSRWMMKLKLLKEKQFMCL